MPDDRIEWTCPRCGAEGNESDVVCDCLAEPVADIRRYRPEPGDVLVYRAHAPITEEQAHRIRRNHERAFPGVRAVILDDGLALDVVSCCCGPVGTNVTPDGRCGVCGRHVADSRAWSPDTRAWSQRRGGGQGEPVGPPPTPPPPPSPPRRKTPPRAGALPEVA